MRPGGSAEDREDDPSGSGGDPPAVATALLDAVIALGSDLHIERVLDRIVESACELTDARYGALGVLDGHDRIEALVVQGIDEEARAAIGAHPQGRGLLGEQIRHPVALRLEKLQDHPASRGLPPGHPPMTTFLGVPVRVRGAVFGILFLTEKADGRPFTARDEDMVLGLAASAGFVIQNARAYAVSERHRQWLEAASRMAESVQPGTSRREALREIAGHTRAMTGARAVAIVAAAEQDQPTLLVSDGPEAARIEQFVDERSGAVSQALGGAERHVPLGDARAVMLLPLTGQRGGPTALVVLLDRLSRGLPPDLELIRSFADQAGLTLDRAQGVRIRESMAVVSDRERVARDLHDTVIQRLFAAGLLVQGALVSPAAAGVDPTTVLRRVGEDLDRTIADIRTTIFDLQASGGSSLRAQVLGLAREYARVLGFAPAVRSHGPVDTVVRPALAGDVLAVMREALANVARHADASRAWVELMAGTDSLTIVVGDDGVGLPGERSEGGLANMVARAARLGGTCELSPAPDGGTLVRWSVPLAQSQPVS